MLAENPPPKHHEILLKQFAEIGVGPGLDVEAQPEAVKQGLVAAAEAGLPMLEQQLLSGDWAQLINGWRYPPSHMGRFGDDLIKRAAEQALFGVAANDPEEALYLLAFHDAEGERLSTGRYEIRFQAGQLPPVNAFWSLTAYDEDRNLIPNPINRYSIGDRTPGLITERDGSVILHLQPNSPGSDRENNWLPTPPQGIWFVGLRMFLPSQEAIDARWQCPPVNRIG